MELSGQRVVLRPTTDADAPALVAILATPEVARWWPAFDLARVEVELTGHIRTLARFLMEERGHHRLTIDPAAANERAIRAYKKVGFREVGVLRRHQHFPDGTWQDGLLMDLLAEELRD